MFRTGILANPDVIGLVLLIQNKQRELEMVPERWSVFPILKISVYESVYFWLTKNTLYVRGKLVLPLMHTKALSASISSLPCTCYRLDYTPLKLVVKQPLLIQDECKTQVNSIMEQNTQTATGPVCHWVAGCRKTWAGAEPYGSKDYPGNS